MNDLVKVNDELVTGQVVELASITEAEAKEASKLLYNLNEAKKTAATAYTDGRAKYEETIVKFIDDTFGKDNKGTVFIPEDGIKVERVFSESISMMDTNDAYNMILDAVGGDEDEAKSIFNKITVTRRVLDAGKIEELLGYATDVEHHTAKKTSRYIPTNLIKSLFVSTVVQKIQPKKLTKKEAESYAKGNL